MPPSIAANSSPHRNSHEAAWASRANDSGSAMRPRLYVRSAGAAKSVMAGNVVRVSCARSADPRSCWLRSDTVLSRLLADVVVLAHLAYLVFIPVGGFLTWRWPKVIPAHLAAIAVAIVSITAGFDCPLTTWENSLRKAGGEKPYADGFIDQYLAGRVYPHGHDTIV